MPRGGRGSLRGGGSSRRGTRESTTRRGFGGGFFLPGSGDVPLHEAYRDPTVQPIAAAEATGRAPNRGRHRRGASASSSRAARPTADSGRLSIPDHIKRLLRLPRMRHLLLDCVEYHANHGLASLRLVAPEFDVERMVRDMRLEMAMFSVADEEYFANQLWRLDNVQACISGARQTWATLGPLGSAVGIIHQYLLDLVDSLGLDDENDACVPLAIDGNPREQATSGAHGSRRRSRSGGNRRQAPREEDFSEEDPLDDMGLYDRLFMDPWAAYGLAFLRDDENPDVALVHAIAAQGMTPSEFFNDD